MVRRWHMMGEESGGDGQGSGGEAAPEKTEAKAEGQAPEKKAEANADPVATLAAKFDALTAQMAALVAQNADLAKSAADARSEAGQAAAKARRDKIVAELTKAAVDEVGQGYALADLGDLDLEHKEADRVKLNEWLKAKGSYFTGKPGGAAKVADKVGEATTKPGLWGSWGRK